MDGQSLNDSHIKKGLEESSILINQILKSPEIISSINESILLMVNSLNNGGRILSCGNGGSTCDANHFAEELTGRYRKNRRPLSAMSISDPAHITCVANDYGFDQVFSRGVEAWGRDGDTLLAISTSGNSKNVILACQKAKSINMKIVGLLGKDGGEMKNLVDIPLIVPHYMTDRIQEIHIKFIHLMIEGIERRIFPEHY